MFSIVFQVFSCAFACVSGACFECFNWFRTHVAIVLFGYFKSKSGVLCMLQSEPLATAAVGDHAWRGAAQ
jgi:hypothetical protein